MRTFTDDCVVHIPPVETGTLVLSGEGNTFTFSQDGSTGLRLKSFTDSTTTWTNSEPLWRILVWSNRFGQEDATFYLEPYASQFQSATLLGNTLTAVWDAYPGPDHLEVTCVFTIEPGGYLKARISATWEGTPTEYAVDSLCVLPLRIPPDTAGGTDVAICGAVQGIMVRNPIVKMRHDWNVSELAGPFIGLTRNVGASSSGKSLAMPVWGYYDESSFQGWHVWHEDHDDQHFLSTFQSDGSSMLWETYATQEDSMVVGNPSRALELHGSFCLRPFQALSSHGWFDIAEHYRDRLDAQKPAFRIPKWRDDPNEPEVLRRPSLYFQLSIFPGVTEEHVVGALESLRTNVGLPDRYPALALSDDHFTARPVFPWSPPQSDDRFRATVTRLRECNVYTGHQQPNHSFPVPFDSHPWGHPLESPTNTFWTDFEALNAVRTTRTGFLAGDTLSTKYDVGDAGEYYQERFYTVQSWDKSTLTLTINESFDSTGQFNQGRVTLVQAATETTPKDAADEIVDTTTGLNQITMKRGFWSGSRDVFLTPQPGDILQAATRRGFAEFYCPYAIAHSTLLDFFTENAMGGAQDLWGGVVNYIDVFPNVAVRGSRTSTCHSSHAGWSQRNADWVDHPKGGGNWWPKAWKAMYGNIRDRMRAHRNPPLAQFYCEYLDETYLETFQGTVTGMGLASSAFRAIETLDDPDDHQTFVAPIFPAVHAGRYFALDYLFGVGSGMLLRVLRNTNVVPAPGPEHFQLAIAYASFGQWPWGANPLSFTQLAGDTLPNDVDLWDPDEFDPSHPWGAADPLIATIRDHWAVLAKAESVWLTQYLRQGTMLRPPELQANTDRQDLTPDVFGEYLPGIEALDRVDIAVVESQKNHPLVVGVPWKHHSAEVVCLLLSAFYKAGGRYEALVTHSHWNLSGPVDVYRVSFPDGNLTYLSTDTGTTTVDETLGSFSASAILFVPEGLGLLTANVEATEILEAAVQIGGEAL